MKTLSWVVLGLLLFAPTPARASWEEMDLGVPYGKMSRKDVDRFLELSRSRGVDMDKEMPKAYQGDPAALSKIFSLSTGFRKMDKMTRVYGNFIFSMFLDMGEAKGETVFGAAVGAQPPDVRQRVRDFVFYAVTQVPRRQRQEMERELRSNFPRVFPAEYVYARGDPLFK